VPFWTVDELSRYRETQASLKGALCDAGMEPDFDG